MSNRRRIYFRIGLDRNAGLAELSHHRVQIRFRSRRRAQQAFIRFPNGDCRTFLAPFTSKCRKRSIEIAGKFLLAVALVAMGLQDGTNVRS